MHALLILYEVKTVLSPRFILEWEIKCYNAIPQCGITSNTTQIRNRKYLHLMLSTLYHPAHCLYSLPTHSQHTYILHM